MTDDATQKSLTPTLTDEQVLSWLTQNPDFWKRYPDLLLHVVPPRQEHGDNVEDFQHHLLGRLQENLRGLKDRYEGLIVASRDNMSTQHQVHEAVLGLVKSPDLEALLQMLRQDLVQLFDVDIVRLALESPVAEFYDTQYGEQSYSGISFIETGMVDVAMEPADRHRLIPQMEQFTANEGLRQIFADCMGLVNSAALLRLHLPATGRQAVLAFGVRHANRFQQHQGVELLHFLARIVEHKLDGCLRREGLDEI